MNYRFFGHERNDMSVTTWRKVDGCLQSIYIWSYLSSPQSLGGGSKLGVSKLSTLVTMRIGKGRPYLFPRALPLFLLPTSELSAYTVKAARKRPLWRRQLNVYLPRFKRREGDYNSVLCSMELLYVLTANKQIIKWLPIMELTSKRKVQLSW